MKHQVGDLVVLKDIRNYEKMIYRLGYIDSVSEREDGGYYVQFFYMDRPIWYSEFYIDAFKENLKEMISEQNK